MQNAATVLSVIRQRGRLKLPLERLYRQLFNPELFLMAYGRLYRNAGALTQGTTQETVDGMSLAKIENLIALLRTERYRWTPVRRVEIPKPKGGTRSLGIPTWSDKLLQEVMRLLLDAYFEPQFSDHSHGFRPGRGCHTALRDVVTHGKGTKWFVEGDVRGCFDNIDHTVLLSLLGESIHDNRFLRLVKQMLQAGYGQYWHYCPSLSGTPQGGVVSPLLANIYLHRLDQYVEQTLLPAYTHGKQRKRNPEWTRAVNKGHYHRREGHHAEARKWEKASRRLPSCDTHDPNFRRLSYARYADDFLLCFAGPKSEAREIKDQLATFLRETLKLELSEEKTLITHAASKAARFLGYDIVAQHADTKHDRNGSRSVNGVLALRVPLDVVRANIARYLHKGKVKARPEIKADSDFDIVKQYQWQYAGLVNYYLLAQNVCWLGRLHGVMQTSLLRTLAAKHDTGVGKLWRKHKSTVQTPYGPRRCLQALYPRAGKEPLVARFGGLPLRQQKQAVLKDQTTIRRPRYVELLQRLLAEECELCGSTEKVEVHHLRKLSDIRQRGRKEKPFWMQVMMRRRRKTLVVCQACHVAIHAGKPTRQRLTE